MSRYCDGLLKALSYGTRKTCVMWSITEFRLLSSQGLDNHDNRGTIKDIPQATDTEMGSYIKDAEGEPFKEVSSIWFDQNLPQGDN